MRGVFYLAWQYLVHHRIKTLILVCAIGLVIYLPIAVQLLVAESSRQLAARADQTPLVVGAGGGDLELVLKALYFHGEAPPALDYSVLAQLQRGKHGQLLPLHVRFSAMGAAIVGTDVDYFALRQLQLQQGRPFAVLGEAVLGSKVAAQLGLGIGDGLASSPEHVFDIAGVYPLKMQVVGVLAPTGGVDDEAVFVDLKTSWVIQGLGHGHQDLSAKSAARQVLKREQDRIVANASVVQYNEIDSGNIASFHFHGSAENLPLTAILVFPSSHKQQAMLLGDFQSGVYPEQAVQPRLVIGDLLATVFSIKQFILLAMAIVIAVTAVLAALIFLLSARLRQREMDTMMRIGSSRATVLAILGSEVIIVLSLALLMAAGLLLLTRIWGLQLVHGLVMG